jgi:hypothetical protein
MLLVSIAGPAAQGDPRDEYQLAQSLDRRDLPFSAFFHYAQIVQEGPAHASWLEAVEGAVATAARLGDDVLLPNLLDKVSGEAFADLPPETLAGIDSTLALFAFRAGRIADAARFAARVPAGSPAFPEAQYVAGLAQQRADPAKAAQTFQVVAAMPRAGRDLSELALLALGRTLFGLHRYGEASAAYQKIPRFSRHWDEALFEGAYADLRNGDPGGALGKLHSLHSPHLREEFVPESLNLAAIVFHQRCLYGHVRQAVAAFDREYLPMRERMKQVLALHLPVAEHWRMLAASDARLPSAVQHHLQKNERVAGFRALLAALDRESARIQGDATLGPVAADLLEAIARQRELTEQLAGKFVQGRLADMERLIGVFEGDKELIAFETTKGEKEMLETRVDVIAQLTAQRLQRPAMPGAGHEYWPFDGEYWPDEIGYYRYTLKDACARGKDE